MRNNKTKQIRKKFKDIYKDEFEDSNESFMDFLLDLIPINVLANIIDKGEKYYSSLFYKYK